MSSSRKSSPRTTSQPSSRPKVVERIQTGIRLEKRILKVLKGVAEYHDLYVGDLLEGICLHAFENKPPFSTATLERIRMLKEVYHLDLTAADSHHLQESAGAR
jgi:hypothetical protein